MNDAAERVIPENHTECSVCDGTGVVPNPTNSRGSINCYQCGGRGYHGEDAKEHEPPKTEDEE